jgi:hypothetical protein
MRSRRDRALASLAGIGLAGSLLAACAGSVGGGPTPSAPAAGGRSDAYARLIDRLQPFEVSGGVRTDGGHMLPETIAIEIRSEVCVESRAPGARFWSLDYDTCFVWVDRDSVGADGQYKVAVRCLDADEAYQSSDERGELRLVQRGPVTFLAESDAGWKIQDTFASSRSQHRDLVLELRTDKFWVVADQAELRARPEAEASSFSRCRFGDEVEVLRFHQGWAECLRDGRIGWMEVRSLGTEEQMKERAPFQDRAPVHGTDRSG